MSAHGIDPVIAAAVESLLQLAIPVGVEVDVAIRSHQAVIVFLIVDSQYPSEQISIVPLCAHAPNSSFHRKYPTDCRRNMSEKTLQDGNHIARYDATQLPDGTYEAQVFVRLSREPDSAETYIPTGSFPTEEAALAAAEQRAIRALEENEF